MDFWGGVSSGNALVVGGRGRGFGALFYYKAVFGFVLLQSRFGVVFNLSEWGDVGGVFVCVFVNIF